MRNVIPAVVILLTASLSAQLNIMIDENRFFDDDYNTKIEINYQVAYRDLEFSLSDYGFQAELQVDFKIEKDSVQVYDQTFTNNIILTTRDRSESNDIYRDKISITLSRSGFIYDLVFTDLNSKQVFSRRNEVRILQQDEMISDLELSEIVIQDTTSLLSKFHRGNLLFFQKPDHIFPKIDEKFFLYYELQNYQIGEEGKYDLTEEITITDRDSLVYSVKEDLNGFDGRISRIREIDHRKLDPGFYEFELKITDNNSGRTFSRQDYFSLKIEKQPSVRIFAELDQEYTLLRYFLPSSRLKEWKNLTPSGKNNFLVRFWNAQDPDNSTDRNEFLEEIKKRIEHCNINFSHFKDGWTTDRGRIYIRNGRPDEVRKLQTGLNTRLGTKDLEIWKYRMKSNLTYVFIDVQTSGDFRLLYVENDDREYSFPDWQDFLGVDFDYELLE